MLLVVGRPQEPTRSDPRDTLVSDRRLSQASITSTTGLLQSKKQAEDYSSAEAGLTKSSLSEQAYPPPYSPPKSRFDDEWRLPSPTASYITAGQDVILVPADSYMQNVSGQNLSRNVSRVPSTLQTGFSHGLPQRRANATYIPPKPLILADRLGPPGAYQRAYSVRSMASSRSGYARSRTYPSPGFAPNYLPQGIVPSDIASTFPYPSLPNPRSPSHEAPVLKSAGAESRITVLSPHSIRSMVPSVHSSQSVETSSYGIQGVPQSAYMRGDPGLPYPTYAGGNAVYTVPFPVPTRDGARQFGRDESMHDTLAVLPKCSTLWPWGEDLGHFRRR